MGTEQRRGNRQAICNPGHVRSRLSSSLSFIPSRKARWGLTVYGLVFVAQGVGKALDPNGYMAALDAFHVLRPAALGPLSLGALGLVWTVLELLAGVAMLYGGLARAPAKQLTLAGIMLAFGISCAYLTLDVGAYARHLPIENCTCFGVYLRQRLSWFVILQESAVIVLLGWLFTTVMRWPSLEHVVHAIRRRSLSTA
jgi:hypothetical protein